MRQHAGLYFSARVVSALLGVVAIAAYSRLLEPGRYGIYTLVLTTAMVAADILFQWIRASVGRLLPNEPATASPVLGTAVTSVAAVGTAVMVATAVLAWIDVLSGSPVLIVLGGSIAVGIAAFETTLTVAQARRKVLLYLLLTTCRAVGAVVLGITLILLGMGAQGPLIGLLLASTLPLLVVLVRHRRALWESRPQLAIVRSFAAYGLPFVAVSIAGSIIAASDRYMLAILVGIGEAGTYAAAYDFAQRSLFMVMAAAYLASSPAVFRAYEQGDTARLEAHLRDQIGLFLIAAYPLATILVATAPLLTRIMFGSEFRASAAQLIPWITLGALLQGLQAFLASYYFTLTKRTRANALIVIGGAVLNIPLNLLLIPPLGALGAAVATLLSYAAVLLLSVLNGRRHVILSWPIGDTVRALTACLVVAPFLALAARVPDLASALALTLAACGLLGFLLLLLDAGGSRATAVRLIGRWRRTGPAAAPILTCPSRAGE